MRIARRTAWVIACALLATCALSPAARATRLVRVTLTPERTLDRLLEAGFDLVSVKAGESANVLVRDDEFAALERMGALPLVVDDDVERHAAERSAAERAAQAQPRATRVRAAVRPDGVFRIESLPPFGAGSMGGFWTLDEVKMKLDELVANDTHDVVADQVDTIGTTLQGRPIWGLRIGRHVVGPDTRPVVLFNALTHAREPEGMQALFYFVDDLLAKADVDPFATSLLDHRVIYIVPVVNPDGYRFNQTLVPGGGGLHRKNLRDTNANAAADYQSDGVDLNRNFGFKWGLDNVGSSGTPSTETYRGTAAFSEPETQAQRDLVLALHPRSGISFHTYSELFLHPWGYTPAGTPDSIAFYTWNDEAMAGNPSISGPAPRVLYRVNGEFNDWMYGDTLAKPRGYTWTPEVGIETDGFWPPPSRIVPLARENLRTCYTVAAIAGPYPRVESSSLSEGALNAGSLAHLSVRARNLGLAATTAGLTATLQPLSAGASAVLGETVFYPALAPLAGSDALGAATFTLAADDSVTPGRLVRYEVRFSAPDGSFSRDTVEVLLGTPTVLLLDPAETLANWSSISAWNVVANDPTHPSRYFADSPAGNYGPNVNSRLIEKVAFNLSPGVHAWIEFEARWMLESAFDGTAIEASLDSVTWIPLAGTATQPGLLAPQPVGLPIYQGSRWLWKRERVDLSPFAGPAGSAVRLRLRTISDAGAQYDGFNVDSLRVLLFDPAQQPAPTLAVGDAPVTALEFAPIAPNPVRASARFAFALPRAGAVRLEVLDLQGRRVRTLANGAYAARRWSLAWDLRDDAGDAVAPGVYFARLRSAGGTLTRRLVVLH
jgi:carboxypeptidase T